MTGKPKVYNNLFRHKWIALLVVLVFMALSADMVEYIKKSQQATPTFFEIIAEQLNDPQMLLFPLMYVLLLFTAYGSKNGINIRTPGELLTEAIHTVFAYVVFFVAANLLYCLILMDLSKVFVNTWSYVGSLYYSQMSPIIAAASSILLTFMRFCFIVLMIYFINTITKKSFWGFWSAFIITYIDYSFYELLFVQYPWGVLPIEHTRIVYTPAIVPDFEQSGIRSPYFMSILYWIGLIVVVYISLLLIINKRNKHEEKVS